MMTVVAIIMVLFHEYTMATIPLTGFMQTSLHLCLAITIIGLNGLAVSKNPKFCFSDFASILLILGGIVTNMRIFLTGGVLPPSVTIRLSTADTLLAILAIAAVLLATKRAIGLSMVMVAAAFIAYNFLGPIFPGFLGHDGASLQRLLSLTYLTVQGIQGTALAISATEIFPLMIYGAVMIAFGGGDLMMGISQKAFGRMRGGIAKVSVLASALFGMISGAGPANAAATGSFTIPMMKQTGYTSHFSGAVVACAAIGGQIMPPVMGASAFIMAEYLGISYGLLTLVALPAALLYFFTVFIATDIEAQKLNLQGMKREEIPELRPVLQKRWYLLLSIATLIVLLVGFRFGPGASGFYATLVLLVSEIAASIVKKRKFEFRNLIESCTSGAHAACNIAVSCACAGIILGIVDLTGLAIKMTSLMVVISGGNIYIMLIMAAIASLIMGMALPTVACYIIVAALAVPPLVSAGVNPISAHIFAFYFGLISNITPPVALTAFVAAGIAEASPIKTAATATKLGIAGFVVPFMIVFDPSIVLQGTVSEIAIGLLNVVFVSTTLAVAFGGYWNNLKVNIVERAVMIGSSILIFMPYTALNIPAYFAISGVYVYHYHKSKRVKNRVASEIL